MRLRQRSCIPGLVDCLRRVLVLWLQVTRTPLGAFQTQTVCPECGGSGQVCALVHTGHN